MDPTARELGEARLDVASKAKTPEDWQTLWAAPLHPFPFKWGTCWKQCIEYVVDDFPAELGFFTDVLGLECNALDESFAMLMGPEAEFYFAIKPSTVDGPATPRDAIRLQFMIEAIVETAVELERRGIEFEKPVQPYGPGSPMHTGYFRTPHGICVDLWGLV